MKSLQDIDAEVKKIEVESEALIEFLTQDGMPGLDGSLLDAEGFPRADIDLYAIRTARHRLACLRTDYKISSEALEKALHDLHSKSCVAVPRAPSTNITKSLKTERASLGTVQNSVFALVDEVFPGSPAEEAGLQCGDRVLAFGKVHLSDNTSITMTENPLTTVSDCFAMLSSAVTNDVPVDVRVIRDFEIVNVVLHPKQWRGRGLIGCHLSPWLQVEHN